MTDQDVQQTIKETLLKQLQLLSERSRDVSMPDELVKLTDAMACVTGSLMQCAQLFQLLGNGIK